MEANYFTTLWWFSPCTDMNQPWVYRCPPNLNPLPTSFPTPSLWVVPEHQLWMPASCLELALVIYFTYLPVKFGKPTKAFSTLVSKKKKKSVLGHTHFIGSWRMSLSSAIPTQWNGSQRTLQRDRPHFPQLAFKYLQEIIFSAHLPVFPVWDHRAICLND